MCLSITYLTALRRHNPFALGKFCREMILLRFHDSEAETHECLVLTIESHAGFGGRITRPTLPQHFEWYPSAKPWAWIRGLYLT